jgi:hypothetical protein
MPRTLAAIAAAASVASLAAATGAEGRRPSRPSQPTYQIPDACGRLDSGTTVFARFGDRRHYVPAPDGGFEAGAEGWTLDGASVVDGNETFALGGDADAKSLSLPAGSSATSPAICLGKGYPSFRFVARKDGGKRARLKVEVLYLSGRGGSRVAGKLRAGQAWRPTKKLAFALGRTRAAGQQTGQVAFRFTPVGAADWQVDDVYVDPRMRH